MLDRSTLRRIWGDELFVSSPVVEGASLKDQVESLEKQIVGRALTRHRWNQSRAANELGLSRVGLANKIKRYNLTQTN